MTRPRRRLDRLDYLHDGNGPTAADMADDLKVTQQERDALPWNRPETHTHVIPVDATQTPEEAWKELCIFGRRVTDTGSERWAIVTCNGEECRLLREGG